MYCDPVEYALRDRNFFIPAQRVQGDELGVPGHSRLDSGQLRPGLWEVYALHPPLLPMGPSRRSAGFSLIELMVVVTIISILVLAVRSSFRKSMANKHTVAAAADVVRMGRRARTDSMGLGRAHLVYFEPGGGAQRPFGRITLLRGNAMHCDHEDWALLERDCEDTLVQTKITDQRPTSCVDRVDLSSTHWFHNPHAILLREGEGVPAFNAPSANTTRALCYDAFGKVQWSINAISSTMTFSPSSTGTGFTGAFTFTVSLWDVTSETRSLPPMVLTFPLGGNPRRLR